MSKHKDRDECIEYGAITPLDDWHIAGCGETLERRYQCKKCLRIWREIYTHAITIDETNNRMTDSEGDEVELTFMEVS